MKNVRSTIAMIVVTAVAPLLTGCLAGYAAVVAGGNVAGSEIAKSMTAGISYDSVTVEKINNDGEHGTIVVRGQFKYSSATIRGNEFVMINSHGNGAREVWFSFQLKDSSGDRLIRVRSVGTVVDDVDLSAVPAGKPVHFKITHQIGSDLWERVHEAEFTDIHNIPEGYPVYLAGYTGR